MSQKGADEVARCLGWLNIMNPMLPYHSFNLKLLYNDNRLLANLLLNLGASEAVDAIKELKGSEFLVIEAYASLSRLLSGFFRPDISWMNYQLIFCYDYYCAWPPPYSLQIHLSNCFSNF